MDLIGFRLRYPEFQKASDALVQTALDEAELSVSRCIYRAKFDVAHGALTAHRLALSPFGRNARLSDGTTSPYWDAYDQVRAEVKPRIMVL